VFPGIETGFIAAAPGGPDFVNTRRTLASALMAR